MPATTPNLGLPYPLGPDPIRVAPDIRALAEAVDTAVSGGGGSAGFVRKDGDTMTGTLDIPGDGFHSLFASFGATPDLITFFEDGAAVFPNGITLSADDLRFSPNRLGQHITLYGDPNSATGSYGLGVQSNHTYWRTNANGGFYWYQGGKHADTGSWQGGINGNELMRLDPNGALTVSRMGTAGAVISICGNDSTGQSFVDFNDSHTADLGKVGAYGGWFRLTAEQGIPALLQSTEDDVRVQAFTYVDIYTSNNFNSRFNGDSFFVQKDHHDDGLVGLEWHGTWRSLRLTTNSEGSANLYCNRTGAATGTSGIEEFARFDVTSSTKVGSITRVPSGVSYNTTSDYRSKTVSGPVTGALDRLKLLKPVMATYHADESQTEVATFVAHEVAEVVPQAVQGAKDAVNADGTPNLQQLDMAKLIPLIVAAIQEMAA